jgi:predicted RNA-binding Zn-ribbon protein involved in translation (DUF1610 family)
MKKPNKINQLIVVTSLACALAVFAGSPVQVRAADAVKGGQRLTELNRIKTIADVAAIQPGDMVVMSCPKCKDVWITYVSAAAKGGEALATGAKATRTEARHLCPGCQAEFKVTGHGKAKKETVAHVCQKCGSKDAFCCVLKKDGTATKGMEK